jgi:PST family polysaccharide transporter
MSNIQRKTATGAAWMILAQLMDRGIGVVSTLILARLLAPDDYGVVAMAMSVAGLLNLLRAFGLEIVLIQHPNPKRVHYDTAWTMNVLVSLGVGLSLMALAKPTAEFYREPQLTLVMVFLGLSPMIEALRNIGVVDFRRNLDFALEFRFTFYSRLVRFVFSVALAFLLQNHWALVSGILIGRVTDVLFSYTMNAYRPRFSLQALHELFHFSKWLLSKNLIQLLTQRSSDFVVGRFSGATALGLFNVSNEIASLPSSELAAPINRALYPGFARQAGDRDALRRSMLDVSGIVFLITLPLGIGLAVTAHLIVPLMLGEKWIATIPIVSALALYGLVDGLGSNTGSLFLAIGRPQIVTRIAILQLVVLIPGLALGVSRAGALGAAWAYVVSAVVIVPLAYWTLLQELELPASSLISRIWRSITAAGLMALGVKSVAATLAAPGNLLETTLQLLGLVALGAIVYVVVVFGLWFAFRRPDGGETHVANLVSARWGSLRARTSRS